MKSVVELNRLLFKFLLLCQVDIQESSREGNAKFNFLGIIWGSKRSWRAHFQAFREPNIQDFGNHVATSKIYWVQYKPPVLSYSKVGTYDVWRCQCLVKNSKIDLIMPAMEIQLLNHVPR